MIPPPPSGGWGGTGLPHTHVMGFHSSDWGMLGMLGRKSSKKPTGSEQPDESGHCQYIVVVAVTQAAVPLAALPVTPNNAAVLTCCVLTAEAEWAQWPRMWPRFARLLCARSATS